MPFPPPHRSRLRRLPAGGPVPAVSVFARLALGAASAALAALAALAASSGDVAQAAERPGIVSLELPVGPRAAGMGSAFVSVADDPTATYWNPAGLTRLSVQEKHFEIFFQHNEWLDDFRQEFVAGGTRVGRHAFGGSFSGFYIGGIEGRDETGRPTVEFGAYDAVTTGSYAFEINDRASVGGSLKYIVTNIDDLTHFAFAGDLGAQVEVVPDVRVGGAVTNLGSGVTYIQEPDDLPTAVQLGGSYVLPYNVANGSVLVALDVRKARGDDTHALFGAEYDHAGIAQVQVGYRTGYDNDGINFGIGAHVASWRLGYAVVPFESDLGATHRFSVGFRL
jgi:hypothetical protein